MAKMKMSELKQASEMVTIFSQGILWEFDFSIKLKEQLESAKELLEDMRQHYIKIIQSHGGEEIQTPRGKQWGLKPPQPKSLDEKATKKEIDDADAEYQKAWKEYEANNTAIEKEYEALMNKEIDVKVNKIPVGEFKTNFTAYLIPELKGKKFSLSPDDIDSLGWLINFSKKK